MFSLNSPSTFYTLYGNPGGVVAAELAQDRFEEDVIMLSRGVSQSGNGCHSGPYKLIRHFEQILNILATLGESPYIRYYQPLHHAPLGPLSIQKTHGSLYGAASAARVHPEDQPQTSRWKAALGGGSSGPVFSGDQIPKRLAVQIEKELNDYKALNPDFPVSVYHVFTDQLGPY